MKPISRIISMSLGIACLTLALTLQRKPPAQVRIVASPSTKILLSDPTPDENEELTIGSSAEINRRTKTQYFNIRSLLKRLAADPHTDASGQKQIPVELVMQEIINHVDPASWRDNGGLIGHMTEIGGVLIIAQTPENLASIRLLLDTLDRANSTTRFSSPMSFGIHGYDARVAPPN